MNEKGRRGFLAGGAAAALTAIAGGISNPAKSQIPASCKSQYGNDIGLANVILKAWSNPGFKNQLLTFPAAQAAANWNSVNRIKRINDVRQILINNGIQSVKKQGVPISLITADPVVLTDAQYSNGYTPGSNEILFVLPDALTISPPSLTNAQTEMCARAFGM